MGLVLQDRRYVLREPIVSEASLPRRPFTRIGLLADAPILSLLVLCQRPSARVRWSSFLGPVCGCR